MNERREIVASPLPIAVFVGVTRSQLRSFGLAIEQAGYHVMVIEPDANVVENLSAQRADILVYNLEMGYTAILRGFRALSQHPSLILLDQDRALPADGFDPADQVPQTPDSLEELLHRRLAPTRAARTRTVAPVVTEIPVEQPEVPVVPPVETPAIQEARPPQLTEEERDALRSAAPPIEATPEVSTAPATDQEAIPDTEARPRTRRTATTPTSPTTEIPPVEEHLRARKRRKKPAERRGMPTAVWQLAAVAAGVLFLLWAIRYSDALRSNTAAGVNGAESRPTTVTQGESVTATETVLVAPEVEGEGESAPNLVAQILEISPAEPVVNDVVNVQVLLRNTGTADITEDFWVDLYVSPDPVPTANQPWTDVADFGSTWLVEGLAAGESRVLETLSADPDRSNLLRFTEEGTAELYVFVDSYGPLEENGTPLGAIAERNEENNLVGPFEVSITR